MVKPKVYFAIRDDDTCYFTHSQQLESCYGHIWDTCPISLSVVPFHACTKSGAVPKEYWSGSDVYPLDHNRELVGFLRDMIGRGRIHITLHGYHHRDEPDGCEFVAESDLARKVADGKRYLEELLRHPIQIFVPPHNTLGDEGYRAVLQAGLHISGIQPFRPSFRGWDPRILLSGIKQRWRVRRRGYRYPWPLLFPDGHRELPYYSLTPKSTLESLRESFDNVRREGGIFCLATHYWEFDAQGNGQPYTIRQILEYLWDHIQDHRDQIKFVTLAELCTLNRS